MLLSVDGSLSAIRSVMGVQNERNEAAIRSGDGSLE